jgi:pyrroline-5-carboxylate reductase
MKTISFIGGGRITRILLQAFNNANVTFAEITVFDPNAEALKALKANFDAIKPTHQLTEVAKADLVVIAVHPPMVMETLEKLKGLVHNPSVVMSLAPKFNLVKMQEALPDIQNLARMNPSAGSWVNKGVNPVSFSKQFDAERKKSPDACVRRVGLFAHSR